MQIGRTIQAKQHGSIGSAAKRTKSSRSARRTTTFRAISAMSADLGGLAEFRRRKSMTARTKQLISRALKGKKRGGVGGLLLGRTKAGARTRAALVVGAGLGTLGLARRYARKSLLRSARTEGEVQRLNSLRDTARKVQSGQAASRTAAAQKVQEYEDKIRSFEAKKKADGSNVNLDNVNKKYQSKIAEEKNGVSVGDARLAGAIKDYRSANRSINAERKRRSSLKSLVKEDVDAIRSGIRKVRKRVGFSSHEIKPLSIFSRYNERPL